MRRPSVSALLPALALGLSLVHQPAFGQDDADAHYRAGLGFLQRGMHQEAAEELRAYLEAHPQAASANAARYSLSICLLRAGQQEAAAKELDQVLQAANFEYAADALFLRAQCAQALGQGDAALASLERLAKEHPTFAEREAAAAMRIELLGRLGRGPACVAATDALLAAKPRADRAARAACVAACAAAAGRDDRSAARLFRVSLEAQPDGPCAATSGLGEAQALHRLGSFDAALARYESLLARRPSADSTDLLRWAAACEIALGKNAEAAARLEKAIATAERAGAGAALADLRFDQLAALQRAGDAGRTARAALGFVAKHADDARATTVELIAIESLEAAKADAECEAACADFLGRWPRHAEAGAVLVRRGLAQARLGRGDEARATLLAASKQAVGDPALARNALATLLDLAVAASDWSAAEATATALLASLPEGSERAEVLLTLGVAQRRAGRDAEAVATLDQLLDTRPDPSLVRRAGFERAQACIALERLDEAKASLEPIARGKEADDLRSLAQAQLATIALRQGRLDDAAGLAATTDDATLVDLGAAFLAAGRLDDAERALSRFIEAHPADRRAAEARARRAIAVARLDTDDADRALAASLADRTLDPSLRASVAYERAAYLRTHQRAAEGAKLLEGLAADPEAGSLRAYARLELARAAVEGGAFDVAIAQLGGIDGLLAALPEAERTGVESHATMLRGVAQLRLGDAAKAAATLEPFSTAWASGPLAANARLVRAEALLAAGRAAEAAADLDAVVASDPSDAILEPALLRLGDSRAAAQDWPASEAAFSRHRQRFPKSDLWFQARFGEARAMEQSGRTEAALAAYGDVVAKHQGPTAARAQFQIGECLFALHRLNDAVREYMKVDLLHAEPEWSAAALYEAGQCLVELDRREDAAKRFDEVIERFGSTRWAELARDRRAQLAPAALPGRS